MIATLAPAKPKSLTAEDLLRLDSKGVKGELIRGEFCETMSVGGEHGEVVMKLGFLMGSVVIPGRLGRLTGSDAGVILERDPDTVREPDAAFISAARLPLTERVTSYYEIIPDLVVEIASPSDSRREVNDKARMWHNCGVPLVWAAYPETRTIDVHRADGSIITLRENDVLDGGEILPGFAVPVRDIFDL